MLLFYTTFCQTCSFLGARLIFMRHGGLRFYEPPGPAQSLTDGSAATAAGCEWKKPSRRALWLEPSGAFLFTVSSIPPPSNTLSRPTRAPVVSRHMEMNGSPLWQQPAPHSVYLNIWYVSSHKISVITCREWRACGRPLFVMAPDACGTWSLAQWAHVTCWEKMPVGINEYVSKHGTCRNNAQHSKHINMPTPHSDLIMEMYACWNGLVRNALICKRGYNSLMTTRHRRFKEAKQKQKTNLILARKNKKTGKCSNCPKGWKVSRLKIDL